MIFRIEIYGRDGDGEPDYATKAEEQSRLTEDQWRELEDAMASAANDWLENAGLDRHAGLAARSLA
jgi:hypothetical protein